MSEPHELEERAAWAIVSDSACIEIVLTKLKRNAIHAFCVGRRPGDTPSEVWDGWHKAGYRCVRANVTWRSSHTARETSNG